MNDDKKEWITPDFKNSIGFSVKKIVVKTEPTLTCDTCKDSGWCDFAPWVDG